jgi:hypothetical protein
MSLVRRNHGRGHSYTLDGRPAPGVTTLGEGYPKQRPLTSWTAKCSANAVLDEWDYLATLSPSDRFEYVRTANERDRDPAARRGTEVHDLAKRLALEPDRDIPIPDELVGHVDAYLKFAREWDVREVLVETVVAKREPRYCGTLDLIADLADGNRWLVDLKTTRSGVFPENALQLAAYRFADFYLDADGAEQPVPEVDRTGVVWLRADGYDLVPVDAGRDEFLLFQMVGRIARFADERLGERYGGYRHVIGEPLRPPDPKEVAA